MRFKFVPCYSEDELYEQAALIKQYDPKVLKDNCYKHMASEAYMKDYPGREWSGQTFGLATNPIVLNVPAMKGFGHLVWTYCHEATHLLGYYRTKNQTWLPEAIAIKSANYWMERLLT